jgi:hypothetical protein
MVRDLGCLLHCHGGPLGIRGCWRDFLDPTPKQDGGIVQKLLQRARPSGGLGDPLHDQPVSRIA